MSVILTVKTANITESTKGIIQGDKLYTFSKHRSISYAFLFPPRYVLRLKSIIFIFVVTIFVADA